MYVGVARRFPNQVEGPLTNTGRFAKMFRVCVCALFVLGVKVECAMGWFAAVTDATEGFFQLLKLVKPENSPKTKKNIPLSRYPCL